MSWTDNLIAIKQLFCLQSTPQQGGIVMAAGIFDSKIFTIEIKNGNLYITQINQSGLTRAKEFCGFYINPV
jgi:hypothetical protein